MFKNIYKVVAGALLLTSLFFQLVESRAGTIHTAYGTIRYYDDSYPASVVFSAYIVGRSADVLTASSLGCGYNAGTGQWYVQCGNFAAGWSAGDVLHIDFQDEGNGTASVDITLTNSSADDAGITVLVLPSHQISFLTTPAGVEFVVDGTAYTSMQTFTWYEGSTHSISVETMQNDGTGKRYQFSSWSNGSSAAHTYTTGTADETVTAVFTTQYELSISSAYGYPQGAGWYDDGGTADFSVTTPDVRTGAKHSLINWTGDYSGSASSGSLTMNEAKSIRANWSSQYYLTVISGYGSTIGEGWYAAGASAGFSVSPESVSGSTGTKYNFNGWNGSGSGAYSGSNSSHTIIMNAPVTEIASWTTQHYVTVSSPFGDVTGEGWYDEGSSASFSVTPTEEAGTEGSRHSFSGWAGSGYGAYIGSNASHTVVVYNPITEIASWASQHYVTITSPYGSVTGEGWYDEGSTATFSVTPTEHYTGEGARHGFAGWSGSGTSSYSGDEATHSVTVTNPITESATWIMQYRLDVNSVYGDPQGAGWYDEGVNGNFSISTPDIQGTTKHLFQNWSGDYSGSTAHGFVTMSSPKTVTAQWNTQYYLTISSDHGSVTGEGWYSAGTSAQFSITPTIISGTTGSRYSFSGWDGTGNGAYSGSNASYAVIMNAPITETARWTVQHYVTVNSSWGVVTGEGWYDEGSTAVFSISPTVQDAGQGTRYGFIGWLGSGVGAYTGNNVSHTVIVYNPITESANWNLQYELVVSSQYGNPQGAGWYNAGIRAHFSVTSPDVQGRTKYIFNKWTGDYIQAGLSGSLSMTGPKSVVANWDVQYYLYIYTEPTDGGSVIPAAPGTWVEANTSIDITATPNTDNGYIFLGWSGDVSGNNNPFALVMDQSYSITANFSIADVTRITTNPTGLTIIVDGQDYVAPYNFNWISGSNHTIATTSIQLEGSGTRHVYESWSDGGSMSHAITAGTNSVYTASFKTQHLVSISAVPAAGGSVVPSPPGGYYDNGTSLTFKATSANGYKFNGWQGDLSNSINPTVLYIDAAKAVTANFVVGSSDNIAPSVNNFLPVPGAVELPRNTAIQFFVKDNDDGSGLDYPTIEISVNGNVIVSSGVDITGGNSQITTSDGNFNLLYQAVSYYAAKSQVSVSIVACDNAGNRLDAIKSFTTGQMNSVIMVESVVGLDGVKLVDNITGLELDIPPGALEKATQLSIDTVATLPIMPDGVEAVGYKFHFSPDGLQFFNPLLIAIPYSQDDLDVAGVSRPIDMPVYCYLTRLGEWDKLTIAGYNNSFLYVSISEFCYIVMAREGQSGVDEEKQTIPMDFQLMQNYPNPFNPATKIKYKLQRSCNTCLSIYNSQGHLIRVLQDSYYPAGIYNIEWDGCDQQGEVVGSGIYFARLNYGSGVEMIKMVKMK
ncbi:T9SS type A sorting domain-containing protein [bacterium]|nr:T9SS type A sorting domain-containing protein [bacterium]